MQSYIKNICYSDLSLIEFSAMDVKQRIEFVTNNLNIILHYFPYDSELIFLRNKLCLFLKEDVTDTQLWVDFGKLISKYLEDNKNIFSKENAVVTTSVYDVCVPTYLLEELIESQGVESKDLAELIASTFSVDLAFSLKCLERYSAA